MAKQNRYHSSYYDDFAKGEKRARNMEKGLFYLLLFVVVAIFAFIFFV